MRKTIHAVSLLVSLCGLASCGQGTRATTGPSGAGQPVTTGLTSLGKGDSPTPRATTPDPNAQLDPGSIEGMAQRSAMDLEQALASAAARDASRASASGGARPSSGTGTPPEPSEVTPSPSGDGVSVGLVSVERNTDASGGAQVNAGLGSLTGAAPAAEIAPSIDAAISTTRDELGTLLAQRAATSATPMPDLALAAAIAGSEGRGAPELGTLAPSERMLLDAIRSVHASFAASASEGATTVDAADALRLAAERAAEGLPLRITDAKLCTRVTGFADYNELSVNAFLAGSAARIVVYTEVDRFATRSGVGGRQIVELSQELDVYHDADGAHCWKRPAQSVSESSRVKRRDFFLTNAIELPPTLTVGKYRLKITMRDLAGNSVAETTIPFTVVADAKLAHTPE